MKSAGPKGRVQTRSKIGGYSALDFFAGSGLATEGLKPFFSTVWANDVDPRKGDVYRANQPERHLRLAPLQEIRGQALPEATLSWASFPCQDLSLAGKLGGISAERSGLVWHWLRVTDEMEKRPPILVAENVTGLLSSHEGANYRRLHREMIKRGYVVGPMVLDAIRWVPQSRPRVFVVAVRKGIDLDGLIARHPEWTHTKALQTAVKGLPHRVWWSIPEPQPREEDLPTLVQFDVPTDNEKTSRHNISLISQNHLGKLHDVIATLRVAPGYKRIRPAGQRLELRFDGNAGCLRTPQGGSSRQYLVLKKNGSLATRLLTVREAARLMGAPDSYKLPGKYNDGYAAMGDAVAVPVVNHLAEHLLTSLAERVSGHTRG